MGFDLVIHRKEDPIKTEKRLSHIITPSHILPEHRPPFRRTINTILGLNMSFRSIDNRSGTHASQADVTRFRSIIKWVGSWLPTHLLIISPIQSSLGSTNIRFRLST